MTEKTPHPIAQKIEAYPDKLTPKGRLISDYLIENPRKAVFMTAR